MPTARELIEQADALMRRNRSLAERPGDAVPPPAITPPDIGDDSTLELPPSPLREALANVPGAHQAPSADDVPVLTEAIDGEREMHEAGDDVPLLTEAVEDIDVRGGAAPLAEDEGFEGLVEDRDEVALLGRVPASVMAVPPMAVSDDESSIRAEGDDAQSEVVVRRLPREDETPSPDPLPDEDPDAIDRALGLHRPPAAPVTPIAGAASARDVPGDHASATDDDDARWAALAEDVRMQVLQRIDMFTDTGLRAQLGERLKPVVDRASADLVATINQHVGDLLRAYVAEAIEREIERWRRESGSK